MLKEYINKILKNTQEGNEKRKIENMVVFLILLIIVIISVNVIWKSDNKQNSNNRSEGNNTYSNQAVLASNNEGKDDLEKRLENILSQVEGAGEVSVMLSYSSTSQTVPMYDESESSTVTEETDNAGGQRKVSQSDYKKNVVYKEEGSQKEPITQTIKTPEITGVIVICDGAKSPTIKADITNAVSAVTAVATHKIQVLERKK